MRKVLPYEEIHRINKDGITEKKCNLHDKYFPNENPWLISNKENFYKNKCSPDGLFPYCKECAKVKTKQWQENNDERYREYIKERDSNFTEEQKQRRREWVRVNQRETGYQKEYQKNNLDKFKQYNQKRQHKNHDITLEQWKACKEYFNNSCAYCGISEVEAKETQGNNLHKEHVEYDGSNGIENCVPACKNCNSHKWKFDLNEWYNANNPIYSEERYNKILTWLAEECFKIG